MTSIQRDPKNFDLVYDNYVALLADADALRSALETIQGIRSKTAMISYEEAFNRAVKIATKALTL